MSMTTSHFKDRFLDSILRTNLSLGQSLNIESDSRTRKQWEKMYNTLVGRIAREHRLAF